MDSESLLGFTQHLER